MSLSVWLNLRGIRWIGIISRLVKVDVYPADVVLEKKHGLKMGRKTHSNINYLCGKGVVRDLQAKFRLFVAIFGLQGTKGASHHFT